MVKTYQLWVQLVERYRVEKLGTDAKKHKEGKRAHLLEAAPRTSSEFKGLVDAEFIDFIKL